MFTHVSTSLNSGVRITSVATGVSNQPPVMEELGEFQHGTVTGSHLCIRSVREISSLLNIAQSAVSGFITK